MTWITTISYNDSEGKLRAVYNRVAGPEGYIDNILKAHSLRPHSLEGHMALYKNALHNAANTIPRWFMETLGVYTSMLNTCDYCVRHHFEGLRKALDDDERAMAIHRALKNSAYDGVFSAREQTALRYTECLTRSPAAVEQILVQELSELGYNDGEILEINQIVSYFAYANRTVLGLGVTVEGDILGLSPNDADAPDDWNHR